MDPSKTLAKLDISDESDSDEVHQVRYDHLKMNRNTRYYNVNRGRRIAVIFYHRKFFDTRMNINDNSNSLEKLKTSFETLDFDVKIYEDLSADKIELVMNEIAKLDTEVNCLFVAVRTHGCEKTLDAYDKKYERSILWKTLEGKLIGVPKLFFIDACRGSEKDRGIEVTDRPNATISDNRVWFKLPTMADYLIMYSTYDDHVAFSGKNGSHFTNSLCYRLQTEYKKHDILQILTFVCQDVALNMDARLLNETGSFKAMPQIVSMLTKLLRFDISLKK